MKHAIRTATVFAFASLCLCANAGAKIVTFQLPAYASTTPVSINDKGQVTGVIVDNDPTQPRHGFLWQKAGGLTRFDVPISVMNKSDEYAEWTIPTGITADGAIIGSYMRPQHGGGGFVRAADGSITTFQVGPGRFTFVSGTNKKGWSVGAGGDGLFLRDPSGATKEFSVPGATSAGASVVNRSRAIAGTGYVQNGMRGYFLPAHGTAVLFGDPHVFVSVTGINDAGTVTGWFLDPTGYTAFVRSSDGKLTTFVAPNGASQTQAFGINNSGTIVGGFDDSNGQGHGFLRTADGTFTPFDIKGATGTGIFAINDKGAITGLFRTQDYVIFGFAGKP